MKILVIDDDHMVRYALSRILQRSGYDVVTASDGKRGMMLVREEFPDVVITDIIMPEQEGIETIGLLRHQYPQMKSSRFPVVVAFATSISSRWPVLWEPTT